MEINKDRQGKTFLPTRDQVKQFQDCKSVEDFRNWHKKFTPYFMDFIIESMALHEYDEYISSKSEKINN